MASLIKIKIIQGTGLPSDAQKGLAANLSNAPASIASEQSPFTFPRPSSLVGELKIPALANHTLAQNIYLAGKVTPLPLCSGMGRCGLCRVRFLSTAPEPLPQEEEILGAELIALGWRLACKHTAQVGMEVELPEFVEPIKEKPKISLQANNVGKGEDFSKIVLAVDLGTTTLYWQAFGYNCKSKAWVNLEQGRELNPQMGAGSEVVSRLFEASLPGGRARLAKLAQDALREIILTLPKTPEQICVAANSAMTSLILGVDATSLARAPYSLPLFGNKIYSLPDLPPVYIPPLLSPFIGGDISAGICAILHGEYEADPGNLSGPDVAANSGCPQFPFLLADLGTNGEFVLAKSASEFYAASIPLGPALEGIGLFCGGMAGIEGGRSSTQVVTSFRLGPEGITSANIPLQEAKSISGTGYFSLLHILLKNKILNPDGSFASESNKNLTQLAQKLVKQIEQVDNMAHFKIHNQLMLTSKDVEEFLKVKAAFSLVFKVLLEASGLSTFDLKSIYLAGSLGLHSSPTNLEALGFLPGGMHKRVKAIGNSSLRGAGLLLQSEKAKQTALNWTFNTKVLSLTESSTFMDQYLEEMTFHW